MQGLWRWVDEDSTGMLSVGEFVRLMRRGWAGYTERLMRLPKQSPFLRPTWNPCLSRDMDSRTGETMSLEEKRRYVMSVAAGSAHDSARKLALHAKEQVQAARKNERTALSGLSSIQKAHPLAAADTMFSQILACSPPGTARTRSPRESPRESTAAL